MSAPRASVLLLTWNGAATLPAVLDAVAAQETDFPFETVAVDSGSTDGTLALLDGRVDRVIRIPNETFNHGLTRNLGIEACRGEVVALLVQDALPASRRWLAALAGPLFADEGLAGTFARQIPRTDASPVTRYYLERWIACSDVPRTSGIASAEHFRALSPMDQFMSCVFDNVSSCIRRDVWRELPFPATRIAEDLEWARAALLAGHRLAFVPEAAVVHSHERSARYELWRTYLVHQRLRALFGLRTIPTERHLLRAVGLCLKTHVRLAGASLRRPRQAARTLALAVAFPLGQYLGALSADTGREILRPRNV